MSDFKHHTIPVINQRTINSTMDFDKFHLSYNPSRANYGSDTTAIVLKGTVFFILNGNHKNELAEISKTKGLQGVIEYFIDNIDKANKLSEHNLLIEGSNDLFKVKENTLDTIGQDNVNRIINACELKKEK